MIDYSKLMDELKYLEDLQYEETDGLPFYSCLLRARGKDDVSQGVRV